MIDLDKMEKLYGPKWNFSNFAEQCTIFDQAVNEVKLAKNDTDEALKLADCCVAICGIYHFADNIGYLLLGGLIKAFDISPEMKVKVQLFTGNNLKGMFEK